MDKRKSWIDESLLSAPSFSWLLLFFLIPSLIVFFYAFKPTDSYGNVEEGWTLQSIQTLVHPSNLILIWRTCWLSVITTLICLLLALPVGYQLATCSKKWRKWLLLLIVVPFWTSFLIRIFAWKQVLHPEGILKQFLVSIGILEPTSTLLYNSGAVLLVMVYTYLPFAVFPIYSSASKFNFQLVEAAMDLGASFFQAFFKVFVPGIRAGIITGMVMVFISALGAYVIPDLVGGIGSEMIGNKIAQRTFLERNLPEASALSLLVIFALFIPIVIVRRFSSHFKKIEAEARNRE